MHYFDERSRRLARIPTGTIATVLRHGGVHKVWMSGPRALRPDQPRIAGPALTVRFTPAREDITTSAALTGPNTFRSVIDAAQSGQVLVAATGGIRESGVIGDILAARMQTIGFQGLITDGAVRDLHAIAHGGLPVWAEGSAAPPSLAALHYCEAGSLVGCGGVSVCNGDYIVADLDGVVVIPSLMVDAILESASEKESFEAWVLARVQEGEALNGLYPPNEQTKVRYATDTTSKRRS